MLLKVQYIFLYSILACSSKGRLIPILEHQLSPMTESISQEPEDMLRDKLCEADAVILITDCLVYEVPENLKCVVEHLDGHIYSGYRMDLLVHSLEAWYMTDKLPYRSDGFLKTYKI